MALQESKTRDYGDPEIAVQAVAVKKTEKEDNSVFINEQIEKMCKKYDTNGDGMFSLTEVQAIAVDLMAANKQTKGLKIAVWGLFAIVIMTLGAMLGVSIVAGEIIKDSKVSPSGVATSVTGEIMRTGAPGGTVSLSDPTRRRLRQDLHGRRMVQISSVQGATCATQIAAMKSTHVFSGSVEVQVTSNSGATATVVRSGQVMSWFTNGDGVEQYLVKAADNPRYPNGVELSVIFKPGTDCQVLQEVSSRALLEEITTPEAHRNRRLNEAHLADACLVYHCFDGDKSCDDPSAAGMCEEWGPSGACVKPLCRWLPVDSEGAAFPKAEQALKWEYPVL